MLFAWALAVESVQQGVGLCRSGDVAEASLMGKANTDEKSLESLAASFFSVQCALGCQLSGGGRRLFSAPVLGWGKEQARVASAGC